VSSSSGFQSELEGVGVFALRLPLSFVDAVAEVVVGKMVGCGRGYMSRLCSKLGKKGAKEPASAVVVFEVDAIHLFDETENTNDFNLECKHGTSYEFKLTPFHGIPLASGRCKPKCVFVQA
jgi:hypothetical protein